MDIGTGCGLAGASGVRPFLPPLLAGALARGDAGINFKHTDYSFLQSPTFLACVLAFAVIAYLADRRWQGRGGDRRSLVLGIAGLALGALLFAGSLAHGHHESWPGLPAGVACAALGFGGVALLLVRARRRVTGSAAALIDLYGDASAIALAGLSIVAPPVGFVALAAFVVLAVRAQAQRGRKFEGLRILR